MKTETQMYLDYIESQERRLAQLLKEKEMIEKDIQTVKKMLENNPYNE